MTDFEPGGLFDGLDDPTPPAFGSDLLPGVLQRGQRLRQQRRMAYAVGSACAVVLVAGAAVGVAASGNNNGKPITPAVTSTPTAHHSKKPKHHHHTQPPGATAGGTQPGSNGGHRHPTRLCTSPTPSSGPTDVPPSVVPTPTESLPPSPLLTGTPADEGLTASSTPAPVVTHCTTPTPTTTDVPPDTSRPAPTYSAPPLLPDASQP